jgi:NAD(P)-dependent dehydrogenase (short-subunit alcohol dehydrogenase family)
MILEKFRVDGQIALVTGASRGIGLGIAKALAEAGAHVIASSRIANPSALQEIGEWAGGAKVDYIPADLEQEGEARRLVEQAVRLHGRLDILVNNAGIAEGTETTEFTAEAYRRHMAINVDSVFMACQAALTPMRRQKSGVILNIGSISGEVSNWPQRQVAYNAGKAAVHMMTKSLASDYAAEGIRVNAIAPGYVATDMTNPSLADPVRSAIWKSLTPMGRAGTIDEIATLGLFLCSPASSYMTGSVVIIDGGYTAR